MRRVLQHDDWSCLAAVAAMITRHRLSTVVRDIGHDGSAYDRTSNHPDKRRGFLVREIVAYLAHEGWTLGAYPNFGDEGIDLTNIGRIELTLETSNPAVLTVSSERLEGCNHVVYWDGHVVHDPNPKAQPRRPIGDYRVFDFWLVQRLEY